MPRLEIKAGLTVHTASPKTSSPEIKTCAVLDRIARKTLPLLSVSGHVLQLANPTDCVPGWLTSSIVKVVTVQFLYLFVLV
jgi:hypothetical protein